METYLRKRATFKHRQRIPNCLLWKYTPGIFWSTHLMPPSGNLHKVYMENNMCLYINSNISIWALTYRFFLKYSLFYVAYVSLSLPFEPWVTCACVCAGSLRWWKEIRACWRCVTTYTEQNQLTRRHSSVTYSWHSRYSFWLRLVLQSFLHFLVAASDFTKTSYCQLVLYHWSSFFFFSWPFRGTLTLC